MGIDVMMYSSCWPIHLCRKHALCAHVDTILEDSMQGQWRMSQRQQR